MRPVWRAARAGLALFGVGLVVACGGGDHVLDIFGGHPHGDLVVRATTPDGAPMAGGVVLLDGDVQRATDDGGEARIDVLADTKMVLTVERAGYSFTAQTVRASPGETRSVTMGSTRTTKPVDLRLFAWTSFVSAPGECVLWLQLDDPSGLVAAVSLAAPGGELALTPESPIGWVARQPIPETAPDEMRTFTATATLKAGGSPRRPRSLCRSTAPRCRRNVRDRPQARSGRRLNTRAAEPPRDR